jgi:hypothetical protein
MVLSTYICLIPHLANSAMSSQYILDTAEIFRKYSLMLGESMGTTIGLPVAERKIPQNSTRNV